MSSMKKGKATRTIEPARLPADAQPWATARLQIHPRQAELFDDLPEPLFLELVESIRREGIRTPLEILNCGTIICGHQRRRAALRLDMGSVPVVIRRDLESQGEEAVLERMIADNVVRRQLDILSTARAYRALKNCRPDSLTGDIRDWLAKRFGRSGRTLDRIERLLDLPRPIQAAVSRGELTTGLASRLFVVDELTRHDAAARIEAGESPKAVVASVAPNQQRRFRWPGDAFQRLIGELKGGITDLGGKIDRLDAYGDDDIATLQAGRILIDALLEKRKSND